MKYRYLLLLTGLLCGFWSCEKDITVELPETATKIVVEGSIEPGQPPIVTLTYSQGYFSELNLQSLASYYVKDAQVTLKQNGISTSLLPITPADLSPQELALAAQFLGVTPEELAMNPITIYTTPDTSFWGHYGSTYELIIQKDEHYVTCKTKMNYPIPLDSIWFQSPSGNPDDTLGYIWATLTDPDTLGNCYRWATKRINHYLPGIPDGSLIGQPKDLDFTRPFNSVSSDEFFNGLTFSFNYYRGRGSANKFDDEGPEGGFYKKGDTVVVKGQSMDYPSAQFIYDLENQGGGPFAIPFNLRGNAVGGLGAFIAYGNYIDTVVYR
jgi:Domain of unknown function (DUF4249)